MTLEEAKAALERAKTGQPAPAGQHGPDPATQRELDKVREEHAQLTRRVEKQSAKIKKIRGRNRARMMEMELRHDAVAAGIEAGENVDFAIQRMRADYHAFKADPAKNAALKPFFEQEDIDAQGYFRALLARRPYLGKAGGQPVSASPTTAPPASTRPGEEPPPVQTPGTPPKAFDAMKASDDEWREHKRRHGIPG